MRKFFIFFIFIVLHLSVHAMENKKEKEFSLTNQEKQYLKENLFNVCTQYGFYPYDGYADGKLIGMAGEYFQELEKRISLRYKAVEVRSYFDLNEKVMNGECDLVSIMYTDSKRFKEFIITSETFATDSYKLITGVTTPPIYLASKRSKEKVFYTMLEEDKRHLQKQYPWLQVEVVFDIEEVIKTIQNDTNTAFVILQNKADRVVQKYGFTKIKVNEAVPEVLNSESIGVSSKHPKLLHILNKTIVSWDSVALNKKILEKYQLTSYSVTSYNKYLWIAIGVLLFIIVISMGRYFFQQINHAWEIDKINRGLQKQVDEQVDELREKDLKLFEQEKAVSMDELVKNVSHHWRQPLATVKSCITNMEVQKELGVLDDAMLDKNIQNIHKNINYLNETLNNFSSFVREGSEVEKIQLQELIENILQFMKPSLLESNIKISDNTQTAPPVYVRVKPLDLKQVILSLITNSKEQLMQTLDHERWIKIELEVDGENIFLNVEDNGGGIPEDMLHRVFEPYFTSKHKDRGVGLSLYMTQKILRESMQGNIAVKNTKNGAKFTIQMPKAI